MTMTEVADRAYDPASQYGQPARLPGLAGPYVMPGAFAGHGRDCQPSRLLGRDKELAVIGGFVDEIADGGGTLLLSGEPGIGKTALLDAAAGLAAASGVRVLRAAGAEFEDVSFSALNQVVLPLRADLARLDGPLRCALNVALGLGAGPAPTG